MLSMITMYFVPKWPPPFLGEFQLRMRPSLSS